MYRNMIQYLTENSFLVFCTFTGASIAIYLFSRLAYKNRIQQWLMHKLLEEEFTEH